MNKRLQSVYQQSRRFPDYFYANYYLTFLIDFQFSYCFDYGGQINIYIQTSFEQMPRKAKGIKKRSLDTNIPIQSDSQAQQNHNHAYRSLQLRRAQALDLLSSAKVPSKFRFRENEIERISAFVNSCINHTKKGYRFLMITGSPGAGKSLCTNTILSKIKCTVIKMNANIVKTLYEVQVKIAQKLLGETAAVTAPQIILELQKAGYKQTCIVYIQEIEVLFKTEPTPITEDFMRLFQKKGLDLILIGISNSIDVIQKSSLKYSFKIQEIENIIFPPYTAEHISCIIKDKLEEMKAATEIEIMYPEKLLKFTAQKLETLKKGDFRICQQYLKGVTQSLFNKADEQSQSFTVTIGVINEIFSKMNISKDHLMLNLPYQQKMMLVAIYTFLKKTDALAVTTVQLQPELRWVCDSMQISYTKQLIGEGLGELEQYSLIELKRRNDETKILLKVGLADIQAVFSQEPLFKKFFA